MLVGAGVCGCVRVGSATSHVQSPAHSPRWCGTWRAPLGHTHTDHTQWQAPPLVRGSAARMPHMVAPLRAPAHGATACLAAAAMRTHRRARAPGDMWQAPPPHLCACAGMGTPAAARTCGVVVRWSPHCLCTSAAQFSSPAQRRRLSRRMIPSAGRRAHGCRVSVEMLVHPRPSSTTSSDAHR